MAKAKKPVLAIGEYGEPLGTITGRFVHREPEPASKVREFESGTRAVNYGTDFGKTVYKAQADYARIELAVLAHFASGQIDDEDTLLYNPDMTTEQAREIWETYQANFPRADSFFRKSRKITVDI